ncbi:MAG: DNA helicase PcrA [Ruminococcaceae bacterium]|nr:DNA helicase PcrA [Oscillospiraceae bacterium]
MQTLLSQLNPAQRQAVTTTSGPLLVLAGAGSGKTRVLTYRIAYLISEESIPPENILAITFTNKAAAEMKTRLEALVGEDAGYIWARTFHSACVRFLRRDIEKIGYKQDFTIYDAAEQKAIVRECIKALNLDEKAYPVSACIANISAAKNDMLSPVAYQEIHRGNFRMEGYCKVYARYQAQLQKYNAVDFDDLLLLTVRLFEECPEVLEYYRNKFKYIHVDEYQDTNAVQYRLVSLLAEKHRNLCVVGDEDQSIYKFRGADIQNILQFEKSFPDAKTIRLEQNYRSTQNILDAANAVISHNTERLGKRLWTDNGDGSKLKKYKANTEYDEASYISTELSRLHRQEGIPFADMVVLYRMNAQSRPIEEQLLLNAVPYKIIKGHRFYDAKEIKDSIAFLRTVHNPDDDVSLSRIINEPKRGIGATSLGKAAALAADRGISLYAVIRDESFATAVGTSWAKMHAFSEIIDAIRQEAPDLSITALIRLLYDKTGYMAQFNPENPEDAVRLENLQEFLSVGLKYEKEAETSSLSDFLDNVSLVSDVDDYDEDLDTVTLMTIHTAKGLEFPVVFVAGFEEGVFPSYRAVYESAEIEEERRLCYVALTRAKSRLYLTHAMTRTLMGATTRNRVSRFMLDIPESLYTAEGVDVTVHSVDIAPPPIRQCGPAHFGTTITSKPMVPRPAAVANCDLSPGDTVRHKKFGEGTVLSAVPVGNDTKLEINFLSAGKKTLLATYAKLEKLQ